MNASGRDESERDEGREWKRQKEIDDQLSTGQQSTVGRDGNRKIAMKRKVERNESELNKNGRIKAATEHV